jgi:hypothetical protein
MPIWKKWVKYVRHVHIGLYGFDRVPKLWGEWYLPWILELLWPAQPPTGGVANAASLVACNPGFQLALATRGDWLCAIPRHRDCTICPTRRTNPTVKVIRANIGHMVYGYDCNICVDIILHTSSPWLYVFSC